MLGFVWICGSGYLAQFRVFYDSDSTFENPFFFHFFSTLRTFLSKKIHLDFGVRKCILSIEFSVGIFLEVSAEFYVEFSIGTYISRLAREKIRKHEPCCGGRRRFVIDCLRAQQALVSK